MKDRFEAKVPESATNPSSSWPLRGANDLLDYWVDAWQRSVLLLAVLRQRGNNCAEHNARTAPHVLSFDAELVLDGPAAAAGELRIGAHRPAQEHRYRPAQATLHCLRPPCRTRPRHRRHEAR